MTTPGSSYNRSVKWPITASALVVAIALLAGCKKNIQNNDAVRQGIMDYLSKRPDLLAMDVNVTAVNYRDNEATATVRFQAKGNTSPGASMTMQYVLERKGNQWAVKGRAGGNEHGANGLPPEGGGPAGGSIGAMPNTTPPGTPSGALPAGHPPINPGKSK